MKPVRRQAARVCCVWTCVFLLAEPWTALAQPAAPPSAQNTPAGSGDHPAGLIAAPPSPWYERLAQPYRWRNTAPIRSNNSSRFDQLLRAGNLYLSLQDAIALALENNIDIEIQRYTFNLADTDLATAMKS